MSSPFPGMDPYIEACGLWGDFHGHLIEHIYQHLADTAPERYLVRTGERYYVELVETEGKISRPFLPDLAVTEPKSEPTKKTDGGVAVAEPITDAATVEMHTLVEEEHRESFVEIHEADDDQRLVTALEVLSPTNKWPATHGWHLYLRKRQSLILQGVHLVEVDLLRGSQRFPMRDPWPSCTYTLLVARAKQRKALVWPVQLLQPLPALPIPLAEGDTDIELNLQPLIDTIYKRSRYARSIDYSKPCEPPLASKEAAWLKKTLKEQSQK